MNSIVVTVIIPICLAVIMFGMGTSLEKQDFSRVLKLPKSVLVGLIGQIILLPAMAFVIAYGMGLSPELAVGLLVLAACAGGPTSNTFAYWAKGDLALSVTLTAIGSCITIFTIPFVVNLALSIFMNAEKHTQLPIGTSNLKLFGITVLPVLLGMSLRYFYRNIALKLERPINALAAVVLLFLIIKVMIEQKDNLAEMLIAAGPAALLLNLSTMAIGFALAALFGLVRRQRITIGIEVGIQNAATGIFIATYFLHSNAIASVSAVYTLIMLTNAFLMIGFMHRSSFFTLREQTAN